MGRKLHLVGRRLTRGIALTTLSAFSPAISQSLPNPTGPSDATIVVTGTRQSDEELRRRVGEFVKKFGVANGEKPVARWTDPICPRVYGLRPEHAKLVVEKLLSVAGDAGVHVAKSGCHPNIAISFVSDGGRFVRTVASKSSRTLAEVSRQEQERLSRGLEPIGWWYSTEVRGKDGTVGSGDPPPWARGNSEGGGSPIPTTGNSGSFSTYSSSIISTQSIRTISQAMVVVDVPKSEGFKLAAVSSYISMVALAEITYETQPSSDSIMSLFSTGNDLTDVTKWDSAFLSTLYKIPLDRQAYQQRGTLRSVMVTQLFSIKK